MLLYAQQTMQKIILKKLIFHLWDLFYNQVLQQTFIQKKSAVSRRDIRNLCGFTIYYVQNKIHFYSHSKENMSNQLHLLNRRVFYFEGKKPPLGFSFKTPSVAWLLSFLWLIWWRRSSKSFINIVAEVAKKIIDIVLMFPVSSNTLVVNYWASHYNLLAT